MEIKARQAVSHTMDGMQDFDAVPSIVLPQYSLAGILAPLLK
jgi:hypothetical protein